MDQHRAVVGEGREALDDSSNGDNVSASAGALFVVAVAVTVAGAHLSASLEKEPIVYGVW